MVQFAYNCDVYPADGKMNKIPSLYGFKVLLSSNPLYPFGFCSHRHKLSNQQRFDAAASMF